MNNPTEPKEETPEEKKEEKKAETPKAPRLGPLFGDIGAVWVEYGSPEHVSMQQGTLRRLTRARRAGPRRHQAAPPASENEAAAEN